MRSTAMRAVLFVAATAFGAAQAAAQQVATPPFEAGKHYAVLTPPQPTSTSPGKVEVTEIFMFGCPGCFGFEPYIRTWLAKKPDYINFVRLPAQWSSHPESPLHAPFPDVRKNRRSIALTLSTVLFLRPASPSSSCP